MLLLIDNIQCSYGKQTIVNQLSFEVAENNICCLLGPSGCGKTTVLRAIAGFEPIHTGSIELNKHLISTPQYALAPEKRRISMVFQDYALFPHFNIAENIAFGLRSHNPAEKHNIIGQLLELVHLTGLEKRYPHELSGGQQQRVALARALAPEPALLLLDEPFSNLDSELRRRLSTEVRDILKERHIAALMVTHDQEEAFLMSDQVGIMYEGRIQQWGTPYHLYHEPNSPFVANFVGQGKLINGVIKDELTVSTELGLIRGKKAHLQPLNHKLRVLLRPDDIVYDSNSAIVAVVIKKHFIGANTSYQLQLPSGISIDALFPSHCDCAIGEQIGIRLAADHLVTFL